MSGAKGYSSYRGRGGIWKIFLAVLLILVILAALSILYLQQHLVYDENGRPRVDLPWKDEEDQHQSSGGPLQEEDGEDDDVPLIVQEPEPPPASVTRSLSAAPLTMTAWLEWLEWLDGAQNEDTAAIAVTLKETDGQLYFDASGAASRSVKTESSTADALAALTATAGLQDLHTIARFSCLHDTIAANSNVRAMGLRNTGGYIFYDGNNTQWLDPSKEAARAYLCELARQVAELGFDEILLTDLSYPTEGKIDKINYNGDTPLEENLALLLTDLKDTLSPYGITLSLELPETVITAGADEVSGQTLSCLAPLVDKIYAATEPERVEDLTAAVTAAAGAGHTVTFVPELTADSDSLSGEVLLLPQAPQE